MGDWDRRPSDELVAGIAATLKRAAANGKPIQRCDATYLMLGHDEMQVLPACSKGGTAFVLGNDGSIPHVYLIRDGGRVSDDSIGTAGRRSRLAGDLSSMRTAAESVDHSVLVTAFWSGIAGTTHELERLGDHPREVTRRSPSDRLLIDRWSDLSFRETPVIFDATTNEPRIWMPDPGLGCSSNGHSVQAISTSMLTALPPPRQRLQTPFLPPVRAS